MTTDDGSCPSPESGPELDVPCHPNAVVGCSEDRCRLVACAQGVAPEDGGAVAWRVPTHLENLAPHCWRHRCCDDLVQGCSEEGRQWGAWSEWFPFLVAGPNECPRGIGLVSPDRGQVFSAGPGGELPALTVANATDPDFGTQLCYQFQVFADPQMADAPLVDLCVPAGEDVTTLDLNGPAVVCDSCGVAVEPTGESDAGSPTYDATSDLLAAMTPGAVRTFYWRARARDDACDSEWTTLGRFVLLQAPEELGCLGCAAARGTRSSPVLLLLLLGLRAARRAGRRFTTSPR